MLNPAKQIAENVEQVRERIANAAHQSGRAPEEVQLIAVTKYVDAQLSAALLDAGCCELGESRPQQLRKKADQPLLAKARWHLIGHLQRNKVRATLPHATLIHSVDSLRLLQAIDTAASERSQPVRVLLEVNCSGEAEKHGLTPDELKQLLPELPQFRHVETCGLMTMAARSGNLSTAAKNFAKLRELRDAVANDCSPSIRLTELSMGMSGDFETAIGEGATIVRIGSLLLDGLVR